MTIPPIVRILPMDPDDEEFKNKHWRQVQDDYFLNTLPMERTGKYYFNEQGLDAPEETIVLFQYTSGIIASASFIRQDNSDRYLLFNPHSIKTFDHVEENVVKAIWPKVTKFGNVKWKLDLKQFPLFVSQLTNVRVPHFWLDADDADYVPSGIDHRTQVERQICERRGRQKFRDGLRKQHGDRCMITGSTILHILEAAHICPYLGEADNDLSNGLLLRADIHTLFDLHLLGIEPMQLKVELHPDIAGEYGHLSGVALNCKKPPSQQALKRKYSEFKMRLRSSS